MGQRLLTSKKREDIQLLRGWAVLIVVIDHAKLGIMPSGFLGVDIFFVISGFLITGIIARGIENNSFSFGEFYFRRARRILPAAFVTILLTSILAIFSATSTEIESLLSQIYGSLTYTVNFVLWQQVDYFGADASLKPLLHMWSLAVEEQFYIFLPILMVLAGSRFQTALIWLVTLLSFVFCMFMMQSDPAGAFYLLPARAWELGIGAILAITLPKLTLSGKLRQIIFWPALLTLVIIPFLPFNYPHPGVFAAIICIATAGVIAASQEFIALTLPGQVMSRLGDMSYSLYLVHWPIMVFIFSGYIIEEPPTFIAVLSIACSIGLAFMMYHLVEKPGMKLFPRKHWTQIISVPVVSALVGLFSYQMVQIAKPDQSIAEFRAPNYGLAATCDYSGKKFTPKEECRTSNAPTVMVWGDSYAMHLVKGIRKDYETVQATFSACAPLLGYAQKRTGFNNADLWSSRCIDFNQDVFEYLKSLDSVETVVLSSPWRGYVKDGKVILSRSDTGELVESKAGYDFTLDNISNTVKTLRALGKNVVVYGPPPSAGGDTSACLERVASNKVVFDTDCSIESGRAIRYDSKVHKLLKELGELEGVESRNLAEFMCNETECMTQINNVPLYRDGGHLSNIGVLEVFNLPGVSF